MLFILQDISKFVNFVPKSVWMMEYNCPRQRWYLHIRRIIPHTLRLINDTIKEFISRALLFAILFKNIFIEYLIILIRYAKNKNVYIKY